MGGDCGYIQRDSPCSLLKFFDIATGVSRNELIVWYLEEMEADMKTVEDITREQAIVEKVINRLIKKVKHQGKAELKKALTLLRSLRTEYWLKSTKAPNSNKETLKMDLQQALVTPSSCFTLTLYMRTIRSRPNLHSTFITFVYILLLILTLLSFFAILYNITIYLNKVLSSFV